jgi:hypothetical protein
MTRAKLPERTGFRFITSEHVYSAGFEIRGAAVYRAWATFALIDDDRGEQATERGQPVFVTSELDGLGFADVRAPTLLDQLAAAANEQLGLVEDDSPRDPDGGTR